MFRKFTTKLQKRKALGKKLTTTGKAGSSSKERTAVDSKSKKDGLKGL